MQQFMRTITTILLISLFFSANCQETKTREKEPTFKNQGEQEDYGAKKLFEENYKVENYKRFEGKILVLNDTIIKYDEEILEIKFIGKELKTIFEKGIFYPSIITGGWEESKRRIEGLDPKILSRKNLMITDFEELSFLSKPPKVKRFRFWLFDIGYSGNPSVYFIELTNDNATSETNLETFINGARLTFFRKGWRII